MTVRRCLIVLGLLVAGASVANAQLHLQRFQHFYVDYELAPPPCPSIHPVVPVVAEGAIWFVWTCNDGRPIVRGPAPTIRVESPQHGSACDARSMIGTTGMNECEWRARYPR